MATQSQSHGGWSRELTLGHQKPRPDDSPPATSDASGPGRERWDVVSARQGRAVPQGQEVEKVKGHGRGMAGAAWRVPLRCAPSVASFSVCCCCFFLITRWAPWKQRLTVILFSLEHLQVYRHH